MGLESGAVAEKLVDMTMQESGQGSNAPQDQGGDAPKAAEGASGQAGGEGQPSAEAYKHQWKDKALEYARNFHKDKEYSEAELEDIAFKTAVGAGKSVQKYVEQNKQLAEQVGNLTPYKAWHDDLISRPAWQALSSGSARIISEDEYQKLKSGDYSDDEDGVPKYIKPVMSEIEAIKAERQKEKEEMARAEQERKKAEKRQSDEKAAAEEITEVRKEFPQFGEWVDTLNRTGVEPPELAEIFEMIESGQYKDLRSLLPAYFYKHKIPEVKAQAKKETINDLKKKAAGVTEKGSGNPPMSDNYNRGDRRSVAEHLVHSTFE